MGLSPKELADQAYKFALGGIDIIKDDHGLTDQVFCPFEERISRCAEAVELANLRTGMHSIYMANVTAGVDRARETAKRAKELGAKALLFCPSLVGFDTLRYLAEDNSLSLPIMVHPSFGGIYATSKDSGIGHGLLYGTIMRLLGADATIYPNFGGRFSFSKHECMDIAHAAGAALGDFPSIFPAPGGGMTPERTEEMLNVYGKDFIILVGAGLHRSGGNLTENAKYLSQMLSGLRG
jgi:ribulose-bisphosphate carboxylase large chain